MLGIGRSLTSSGGEIALLGVGRPVFGAIEVDPAMLKDDTVTLPIQINGKRRDEIEVSADISKEELEKLVMANQTVERALDGSAPKKLIIVPGRIVNVVI